MNTTFNLRNHSANNRAIGHERIKLVRSRLSNQTARIAHDLSQTFDIGEVHQLFCSECFSNCPSNCVGIDVVRLSIGIDTNRGNDRNKLIVK